MCMYVHTLETIIIFIYLFIIYLCLVQSLRNIYIARTKEKQKKPGGVEVSCTACNSVDMISPDD
jgi:hypothetical protein